MNNVSLYRIVHYMLDNVLRKTRTLAWLKVSVSYLQRVVLLFDEFNLENRRLAWLTPQVCYLEKYLRIMFASNAITIADIDDAERYCSINSEADVVELFLHDTGTYFYTTNELQISSFVVQYSPELAGYSASLRAAVDRYKLPGFKYLLQIV
ncbi:MAG: hypothetical protein PHQ65_07795 [Bacteroidales bacterium]|nr:hypothetical protein [Bacteroidales bacterium]MDD3665152.1 hypothetical protein [Bacteroidales bacterium]